MRHGGTFLSAKSTTSVSMAFPCGSWRRELPRGDDPATALECGKREIGAPGFEPGTSCSQSTRATRLRHAPSGGEYRRSQGADGYGSGWDLGETGVDDLGCAWLQGVEDGGRRQDHVGRAARLDPVGKLRRRHHRRVGDLGERLARAHR